MASTAEFNNGEGGLLTQSQPQAAPGKRAVGRPISRQDWERLLAEVVPHDPENQWYCSPSIPQKKLDGAIRKYGSGLKSEDVLALLDGTLFGSAAMGVLLTTEGIYYRRSGKGGKVRWSEIADAKQVGSNEIDITVNGGSKIRISCGVGLLVRDRLRKLPTTIAGNWTAGSAATS